MSIAGFLPPCNLRFRTPSRCKRARSRVISAQTPAHAEAKVSQNFTTSNRRVSGDVVRAVRRVYTELNAAVHQGGCAHHLGRQAADLMTLARGDVAAFVGAEHEDEIVFAASVAAAVNVITQSVGKTLRKNVEVIVSSMADDDVIVPLQVAAKQMGLKLRFVHPDITEGSDFNFESIASLVSSKTRLVILPYVSSITGNLNALEEIIDFLKSFGTVVVIDATKAIEWTPINVQSMQCDFLIAGGEALGCPPGAAFFFGRADVMKQLPPIEGGDNTLQEVTCKNMRRSIARDSSNWAPIPERFEVGVTPLSVAASLSAATRELERMDRAAQSERSAHLGKQLYIGLQRCPFLKLYGNVEERRVATACFCIEGVDNEVVAAALAGKGVFVEIGCHGSHIAHWEGLKLSSTMRIVMDPSQHSEEDISSFVKTLSDVYEQLRA